MTFANGHLVVQDIPKEAVHKHLLRSRYYNHDEDWLQSSFQLEQVEQEGTGTDWGHEVEHCIVLEAVNYHVRFPVKEPQAILISHEKYPTNTNKDIR